MARSSAQPAARYEQCCALEGFVRCIEPTFNGWHLCKRHVEQRPRHSFNIIEEFADQSPIEQTPRAALRLLQQRREFRRVELRSKP